MRVSTVPSYRSHDGATRSNRQLLQQQLQRRAFSGLDNNGNLLRQEINFPASGFLPAELLLPFPQSLTPSTRSQWHGRDSFKPSVPVTIVSAIAPIESDEHFRDWHQQEDFTPNVDNKNRLGVPAGQSAR